MTIRNDARNTASVVPPLTNQIPVMSVVIVLENCRVLFQPVDLAAPNAKLCPPAPVLELVFTVLDATLECMTQEIIFAVSSEPSNTCLVWPANMVSSISIDQSPVIVVTVSAGRVGRP